MVKKRQDNFANLVNDYNRCLQECRHLYLDAAQRVIRDAPHLLDMSPREFMDLMEDLHRGFLIKLLVSIAGVDHVWTYHEENFAGVLFYHLWQRRLSDAEVRESIRGVQRQASEMNWLTLVQPFQRISILNDMAPALESIVIRTGNLIARADGKVGSLESSELKTIQETILSLLSQRAERRPEHLDPTQHSRHAIYDMSRSASALRTDVLPQSVQNSQPKTSGHAPEITVAEETKPSLVDALSELDQLIGMELVKKEVRTLTNFLEVQRKRQLAGLPETKISLHMVFAGNPGTGKTSVARVLGKIFGAMGILKKGHLVETDRSGLVAEFAGQTAPKTNRTIDSALDGILFIDEAYSLVSESGNDPYGAEAIQTLLKRMEDDRERLIVILAGYPKEMQHLIRSNPGLSSRVGRRIEFADYTPIELAQIFQAMCDKHKYETDGRIRGSLLLGLTWLYEHRDKHFGNGRLVRNVFEGSIRHLANRVAELTEYSKRCLSRFLLEDIELPSVPITITNPEALEKSRFEVTCGHCGTPSRIPADYFCRKVKCKNCQEVFRIEWGIPVLPR
ncbi:MAG TPA: AAA family ATPase [Pirellulaceae bacterium]|nr:AAA family ATPase [Pirellulaceae bacterium]HMO93316.1 AAA family ATPase [Pirellulaceae bacterium]HMP69145.1 AAA family ATPase [Pirellulaceae bacterium]